VRVTSVSSTYCFVLSGDKLAQVVRVIVGERPKGRPPQSTRGTDLAAPASWRGLLDPARAGQDGGPAWAPSTDAGLAARKIYPAAVAARRRCSRSADGGEPGPIPGSVVKVRAVAEAGSERATAEADVVVREPGWRMIMVRPFHYDPVWWNTQAGYTSGWDELLWAQDKRDSFQHTGLVLVEAHLQRARVDPRYKFVLAEVDYLKPFWDLYPDRRAELKALLEAGAWKLSAAPTTSQHQPDGCGNGHSRCVYGMGFQRERDGCRPPQRLATDVFGHDPQFPGIMADCGLDSSAGHAGRSTSGAPPPHWLELLDAVPVRVRVGGPERARASYSYMPNHYSSGWELERATSLEGSMWRAYELFSDLQKWRPHR